MRSVSVITSTYNKSKYLDLTLAGYTNQNYTNFEIVIVDDGSQDDTKSVINRYENELNIKYIFQENKGIATARNSAIDASEGDIIIIVDDDRIPCPAFISSHVEKLAQDNKLVSIGYKKRIVTYFCENLLVKYDNYEKWENNYLKNGHLVDGLQLFSASEIMHDFNHFVQNTFVVDYHYNPVEITKKYDDNMENFHFGWSRATGGNMAFHKCIDKRVEFDITYKGYGFEDLDLAYQLHLQGYKFLFNRQALNYHQEHPRNSGEKDSNFKNQEQFYSKYHRNIDVKLFEHSYASANELGESEKELALIKANEILSFIIDNPDNQLIKDYILTHNYANKA